MKPVVTVEEMRAIDQASSVAEPVLIDRAGWAVAHEARRMLGGTYGRRVVVAAGKGNNGADGRRAARLLARWGAWVRVVEAGSTELLPPADLVIDAAYGTGFSGNYRAPHPNGIAYLLGATAPPRPPVLAVDIASGVDGNTGVACDGAVRADVTVTFAALKPGHLYGEGAELSGRVELIDIGLSVKNASVHVVEAADVVRRLPSPGRESHKWRAAVAVVAGSPGMMGAAHLVATAAQRAGAGMVRLGSPGVAAENLPVGEAVALPLPGQGWDATVLEILSRVHTLVIGPGLGREPAAIEAVHRLVAQAQVPVIVDGDGLFALGEPGGFEAMTARKGSTILTPHDAELARLLGRGIGPDKLGDVRELARRTGAVVLAKGSTTTISCPDGKVLVSTTGSAQLATAGTGDVLSGVIGAFVAGGMDPMWAAASAAFVHGEAARHGLSHGLVAGDLPLLIAKLIAKLIAELSTKISTELTTEWMPDAIDE